MVKVCGGIISKETNVHGVMNASREREVTARRTVIIDNLNSPSNDTSIAQFSTNVTESLGISYFLQQRLVPISLQAQTGTRHRIRLDVNDKTGKVVIVSTFM